MALGPASPSAQPPIPPHASPPIYNYEADVMAVREQMFPLILTTYGIAPCSSEARQLAVLLGQHQHASPTPYSTQVLPPRIAYHGNKDHWSRPAQPSAIGLLSTRPPPFAVIPDEVLSLILSFEYVPRMLMWKFHNVSMQWRRALHQPLLGYYNFIRMGLHNMEAQFAHDSSWALGHLATHHIGMARRPVPRPYNLHAEVMRCPGCEWIGIVEQSGGGTTWARCLHCGKDVLFDFIKNSSPSDILAFFPFHIKMAAKAQAEEPHDEDEMVDTAHTW